MSRNKSTLGLILSGLATGGFVKHTHDFCEPSDARAPLPAAARAFDYPRAEIEFRNRILSELETADHVVRYVRFKSAGLTRQPGGLIKARYYHSKRPGAKRLIVVLPIFGSYTYPQEAMVRSLRRRYRGDCHILMVMGETYLLDWFGLAAVETEEALFAKAREMAEHMRVAVIDVRRCIDWATVRPEVDNERIGLIGFSMSAFLAALALGVEPRFNAGVLIMGGAHPADIIASCGGKPGMARKAVLARLGISWEQYYHVLHECTFANDPAHFAGCYRPERLLLFEARYDTCMPARSRDALWNAMGRPERYSMHYGHKSAFLAMTPLGRNFMRRRTLEFLHRRLGAPGAARAAELEAAG